MMQMPESSPTPQAESGHQSGDDSTWLEPTLIPSLLLGSRTIVEQDGLIEEGTLTLMEGDLIEVGVARPQLFVLGKSVWLTVESVSGMYRMPSRVIGRREGSLALLFPYERYLLPEEKRIHPRIEVNCAGRLLVGDRSANRKPTRTDLLRFQWSDELRHNGLDEALLQKLEKLMDEEDLSHLEQQDELRRKKAALAEITVCNISLEGVGFRASKEIDLPCSGEVEAVLDLGFELHCRLEVLWRQDAAGAPSYGARLGALEPEAARQLRAFIVHEQMKQYYLARRAGRQGSEDGAAE